MISFCGIYVSEQATEYILSKNNMHSSPNVAYIIKNRLHIQCGRDMYGRLIAGIPIRDFKGTYEEGIERVYREVILRIYPRPIWIMPENETRARYIFPTTLPIAALEYWPSPTFKRFYCNVNDLIRPVYGYIKHPPTSRLLINSPLGSLSYIRYDENWDDWREAYSINSPEKSEPSLHDVLPINF